MCSLQVPLARYEHSTLHDDLLFLSMFLTAVFGLMCLGNSSFPMISPFETGGRSLAGHLSAFVQTTMNSSCPPTKLTIHLKGVASSLQGNASAFRLASSSCATLPPVTSGFRWVHPSGLPLWELFPARRSSCFAFATCFPSLFSSPDPLTSTVSKPHNYNK
jgi:hypothetical protein